MRLKQLEFQGSCLKDLKCYALENDTNVTAVVLRACREFLTKDKMFKDKYKPHIAQI